MAHALLPPYKEVILRRSRPNMKKLLTMLFALVIVFSLAMPVFAAATGAQDTSATTAKTKKTKMAKTKKAKKTTATTTTQ
jgi:hypothetical protein